MWKPGVPFLVLCLLFLSCVCAKGHYDNNDQDRTTIVYTTHLNVDVALVLSLLLLLTSATIVVKILFMICSGQFSRGYVRALYLSTVLSAFARGVFFIVVKVNMPVEVYYLTWFIPTFINLASYIWLTRLWADYYAETRCMFKFEFKKMRRLFLSAEMVFLAGIYVVQAALYVVIVVFPDDEYTYFQTADLGFIIFCEAMVLAYAIANFILARVLIYNERKKGSLDVLNATEKSYYQLFRRTDVLMAVWTAARLLCIADYSKAVDHKLDSAVANTKFFWLYIGPFYLLSEVIPIILLVDSAASSGFSKANTRQRNRAKRREAAGISIPHITQSSINRGPGPPHGPKGHGGAVNDCSPLLAVAYDPRVQPWVIPFSSIKLVGAPIGTGVSGEVHRAIWNDTIVAVKRLRSMAERDLEDFCDEIRILSSLRHFNVVRFYGACVEPPESICIVSEFLERGNLRQVIDDPKVEWSLQLAVRMAQDICRGMIVIHSKNIIHRDLKPENLLLDKHFTVKIGDFGISKVKEFNAMSGGFLMTCVGSGSYIAPELLLRRPCTQKADVFSFGMIFWELLFRTMVMLDADQVLDGVRPNIPEDTHPLFEDILKLCWHDDDRLRPQFSTILAKLKEWQASPDSAASSGLMDTRTTPSSGVAEEKIMRYKQKVKNGRTRNGERKKKVAPVGHEEGSTTTATGVFGALPLRYTERHGENSDYDDNDNMEVKHGGAVRIKGEEFKVVPRRPSASEQIPVVGPAKEKHHRHHRRHRAKSKRQKERGNFKDMMKRRHARRQRHKRRKSSRRRHRMATELASNNMLAEGATVGSYAPKREILDSTRRTTSSGSSGDECHIERNRNAGNNSSNESKNTENKGVENNDVEEGLDDSGSSSISSSSSSDSLSSDSEDYLKPSSI